MKSIKVRARELLGEKRSRRAYLHICFVCGKKIKGDAIGIGKELYRHKSKCAPLGENWKSFKERREKGRYNKLFQSGCFLIRK